MAVLWRLSGRTEFAELRRRGRRRRCGPITVTWAPGPTGEPPRVGFAIPKAFGNAVARNQARRRLRAVLVEVAPELEAGAYLVSVSPAAVTMNYGELRSNLCQAIAKLN